MSQPQPSAEPYAGQPAYPMHQPYSAQQYAPYDPAAPAAPRAPIIWDRILTIALLSAGLFGAGLGVLGGLFFEQTWNLGMQGTPYASPPAWIGAVGPVMAGSHILLYLAAAAIAIPLMIRNRIAFWAPLGAGVLAALIYHGSSFVVGFAVGFAGGI